MGVITSRGGESELQFRQGDRGSDRDVGRGNKVGKCICFDAEGRPNSNYPRDFKSTKAGFENSKVRSLEAALGIGNNVEGSGNISGKPNIESLYEQWSGSRNISYRLANILASEY